MEEAKPWWASKTIWTSIVGGAATLATVFGVHVLDDPELQAQIVAGALAIAGIVLRFRTSTPVK